MLSADTEALIQTVREGITVRGDDADEYNRVDGANAALDSLAAELERLKQFGPDHEVLPETIWRWRAEAAEAELERVKAERDTFETLSIARDVSRSEYVARLDKALAALREIAKNGGHMPGVSRHAVIARRCLAEIEGEAT